MTWGTNTAISDKGMQALEIIAKLLPKMTKEEKAYLLGYAEGMASIMGRMPDPEQAAPMIRGNNGSR